MKPRRLLEAIEELGRDLNRHPTATDMAEWMGTDPIHAGLMLAPLIRAGLLRKERQGGQHVYRITDEGFARLRGVAS